MGCHVLHVVDAYAVACSVIGSCLPCSFARSVLSLPASLPRTPIRGASLRAHLPLIPSSGASRVSRDGVRRLGAVLRYAPAGAVATQDEGKGTGVSRASPAAALNAATFPGPVFAFRHVVPPSRFVPPLPHPPLPAAGPLFARNRGRARAGVGAGAVRAPDCPRPREAQAQGAPRLFAESGAFFAPARTGEAIRLRADAAFLPPRHSSTNGEMSSKFRRIIPKYFRTGYEYRSCGIRRHGPR